MARLAALNRGDLGDEEFGAEFGQSLTRRRSSKYINYCPLLRNIREAFVVE